jgi:hypothetical protein
MSGGFISLVRVDTAQRLSVVTVEVKSFPDLAGFI